MTRTRKLALSVKEFSHLVSESLDIANAIPSSQPFVESTTVVSKISPKSHPRPPSFQRIFSRPTPGQHREDPPDWQDHVPETPRKMITWPFSRSPRKNRPVEDEDNPTDVEDPDFVSSYPVTALAAASTSSLGSLIPVHERLFQVVSRDGPSRRCNCFGVATSSPRVEVSSCAGEPPVGSGPVTLDEVFGSGPATRILSRSNHGVVGPVSGASNQSYTSFESSEASHPLVVGEPESSDEDPTPRAPTFDSRTAIPPAEAVHNVTVVQRGRSQHLSVAVPSRSEDVLALRPAVGVTPHIPAETEPSISACSASFPVARGSSPTFPVMKPSDSGSSSPRIYPSIPFDSRIPTAFPDIASPFNMESAAPLGFSPRQRKRAMSRSMTPPPSPRPPPTGPLPAVPSSVPPVPPLPPLLHKISMNTPLQPATLSPPRSTTAGTSANPTCALPPSPPGGLRLPSRLSWVNGVRAVLPSPPASPTKSLKSLAGKSPLPTSLSKAEKKRPNELKRPTSIGVIEAADNSQVRRTKSILLLGSKSKSSASLGPKRVQIHTDVNLDAGESRKPRRKSSAVTVSHPVCSSDFGSVVTPTRSSELLVPRERRHSAPMLSDMYSKMAAVSLDWTLSLPLCTDVPGNKILPSPLLTPRLELEQDLEEVQVEDWTLCMPLKGRVNTPTIASTEETTDGRDSEYVVAETSEDAEARTSMQLPTPSPSPTWSTPPSIARPLEPEESMPIPEDRPASPASLGPHVGGLDLAGGCGKRASGWHVYGWFDEVKLPEDQYSVVSARTSVSSNKPVKTHVAAFRMTHDSSGRHPSQDSMSTVSTSETMFYSARSSLLVN